MVYGKVEFEVNGQNGRARKLKLTLVENSDADVLSREGLAGLRRKRIVRLAREALDQGYKLGYDELSRLLLTSLSTLKRDVKHIENKGGTVPLKGRRKKGKTGMEAVPSGA